MFNKDTTITALQLVKNKLLTCPPSTPVSLAAQKVRKHTVSSILVEDKGKIVGIWTEADCTKLSFEAPDYYNLPISKFMSAPVITIYDDTPLQEIVIAFHSHRVRHLLVVNKDKVNIGILSQTDVIKKQGIERYLQLRKVKDNYNSRVPIISGTEFISSIVKKMSDYKSTSALIKNYQSDEYGIITERDLLRLLANQEKDREAWHYANPLIAITEEDTLYQAYIRLQKNNIRHLVVLGNNNQIAGVLSLRHIMSDIEVAYFQEMQSILTQRDDALKTSKKNLQFAERIIEASLDSIMVTDHAGNILSVNSAFTRLTGYTPNEVIGQSSNILSSGMQSAPFYQEMWQALNHKGQWQGEIWNKKKNGEIYPEWLTIVQINEENEPECIYAAIFSDITERKITEKKIHALAFFDELTGLPNRRLFNDRFDIALSTAHRNEQLTVVLFLDLDRFKQINDTLGHNIGDELLKAAAGRIKNAIKEGDTVSRFGGDEFVILLTEMNSVNDIIGVIERIAKVLNKAYEFGTLQLQVTSSIGAAVYPNDGLDAETLLQRADTAMYNAKDNGRNSYQLYSPKMNTITMERLITQNFLRSALNNNEFELFYQLQIDSSNQRIVGVEALLRWEHPKLGRVSPAHFIPMAEELGIIVEIDRWVLSQACRQRQIWHQQGLDCGRISVNISAMHFRHNLIDSVNNALQESTLIPSLLELEVTESGVIENIEQASSMLTHIRDLGVKNAIDDFGTGFSSLNYLTKLPLDVLKIDGGFVSKLPNDQKQCQIVSTIIAMAKGLELSVIAEGVETKEQVHFLSENGCVIMQGYLYSVPAAADITGQLIAKITNDSQEFVF